MDKTVFPADFDGTFRFTNFSAEDFTARWNSRPYTFKANTTSPMIILDATPLEIQYIRKKFAKELAEREFSKSDRMKQLTSIERANNAPALNSFRQANAYSTEDIKDLIQRALEPLKLSRAEVGVPEVVKTEEKLTLNRRGRPNTRVVSDGEPLMDKAREGVVD